jgi:hypothetical protein
MLSMTREDWLVLLAMAATSALGGALVGYWPWYPQ